MLGLFLPHWVMRVLPKKPDSEDEDELADEESEPVSAESPVSAPEKRTLDIFNGGCRTTN